MIKVVQWSLRECSGISTNLSKTPCKKIPQKSHQLETAKLARSFIKSAKHPGHSKIIVPWSLARIIVIRRARHYSWGTLINLAQQPSTTKRDLTKAVIRSHTGRILYQSCRKGTARRKRIFWCKTWRDNLISRISRKKWPNFNRTYRMQMLREED